jgi:glycosyltransferase involved in cell wall biosynthesis
LSDDFEIHMTVSGPQGLEEPILHSCISEHDFDIRYTSGSLFRTVLNLRRFIQNNNFTLLHLHTLRAGLLGCLAAYQLPIGIVYTGHGWRFEQKPTSWEQEIFQVMDKFVCSRADIVVCISQRDYSVALKNKLAAPNRIVVIPTQIGLHLPTSGEEDLVFTKANLGISKDDKVIGNIAKLIERKDPLTFIRMAQRVREVFPNTFFLWVGDGELRAQVEGLATGGSLRDHFAITGMVPHDSIPGILRSIDLFINTSLIEVVPLSLLEAQATAKPIVSSAYLGVEEVIDNGRTGYTFPIGDDRLAAECVIKLLTDEKEAARIANEAIREFQSKRANPRKMSQDYLDVFRKTIGYNSQ